MANKSNTYIISLLIFLIRPFKELLRGAVKRTNSLRHALFWSRGFHGRHVLLTRLSVLPGLCDFTQDNTDCYSVPSDEINPIP